MNTHILPDLKKEIDQRIKRENQFLREKFSEKLLEIRRLKKENDRSNGYLTYQSIKRTVK